MSTPISYLRMLNAVISVTFPVKHKRAVSPEFYQSMTSSCHVHLFATCNIVVLTKCVF